METKIHQKGIQNFVFHLLHASYTFLCINLFQLFCFFLNKYVARCQKVIILCEVHQLSHSKTQCYVQGPREYGPFSVSRSGSNEKHFAFKMTACSVTCLE